MDIKLEIQNLKQLQDRFVKLGATYTTNESFLEALKAQVQILNLIDEGLQKLSQIDLLDTEKKMYKELQEFWQDKDFQIKQIEKEIDNLRVAE